MERDFLHKTIKAHRNILTCLDQAFKAKDLNLIHKNVQRLNALTSHVLKEMDINLINLETVKAENQGLREENNSLMDEKFKSISEEKGVYKEAKKMLDEFYNEEGRN